MNSFQATVARESVSILAVDDDHDTTRLLCEFLQDFGMEVEVASTGAQMKTLLARRPFDVVLLDLMLPDEPGMDLCAWSKERTPERAVIMLTAADDSDSCVEGLARGADDYIAKPFHLREVLARIRTVLRRTQHSPGPAGASEVEFTSPRGSAVLRFSGWELDLGKRELRQSNGKTVDLTTGEFDLLRVFAQNPQRVLDRDKLMDLVKGREWAAYDRSIDAQIVRLRKKIEADPHAPALIKTIRGAGYLFAADVASC